MLTRAALRAFSTETLKVINDVAKQQFVVKYKNDEAVLEYKQSGNNLTLISTNVPEVFQGKGVGKILAKHAFNHAVEKNLHVTCQCIFLCKFYEKNRHLYKSLKVIMDMKD